MKCLQYVRVWGDDAFCFGVISQNNDNKTRRKRRNQKKKKKKTHRVAHARHLLQPSRHSLGPPFAPYVVPARHNADDVDQAESLTELDGVGHSLVVNLGPPNLDGIGCGSVLLVVLTALIVGRGRGAHWGGEITAGYLGVPAGAGEDAVERHLILVCVSCVRVAGGCACFARVC